MMRRSIGAGLAPHLDHFGLVFIRRRIGAGQSEAGAVLQRAIVGGGSVCGCVWPMPRMLPDAGKCLVSTRPKAWLWPIAARQPAGRMEELRGARAWAECPRGRIRRGFGHCAWRSRARRPPAPAAGRSRPAAGRSRCRWLTVAPISWPEITTPAASNAARRRSATRPASAALPGMIAANSSPPSRPITSVARMWADAVAANTLSASSPTAWPKRSLIDLNLSRSKSAR